MGENKEFSVTLNATLDKFKAKMNKAKQMVSQFAEDVETGFNIDLDVNDVQLDALKKKLKSLAPGVDIDFDAAGNMEVATKDVKKLEQAIFSMSQKGQEEVQELLDKIRELSKLSNGDMKLGTKIGVGLKEATKSIKNVVKGLKEVQGEAKKTENSMKNVANSTTKVEKGFKGIMNSAKRFALSLIGVQSVWRVLSRASSAYMAKDIELANKMSAIWVGIGAMLEPILSSIANGLLKMVMYLNAFIKGLTGVDMMARAMKKTAASANAAAKATQQLAGFDELNNIDQDNGSGGADMNWASAFEDVKINTEWAEKLEKAGEIVRKVFEWIKDNWVAVVVGIVAVAGAFLLFGMVDDIDDAMKNFSQGLEAFFSGMGKAASTIALLGGLALVIWSISDLLKAFGESGMSFVEASGLIAVALGSVAAAFALISASVKTMSLESILGMAVVFAGLALVLEVVADVMIKLNKNGVSFVDILGTMAVVVGSIVVLMGAVALIGPAMTAGLVPFLAVVAGISATLIVMAATLPTILDATGDFITNVAPSLQKILETIGKLIVDIIDSLGTTLPPIIREVGRLFSEIFSGIALVINSVGNTMVNIMRQAETLVNSVLSAMLNFIRQLGPAINTFVDNAIQAVTKLINFLVSGIEYMINTLVIGSVKSFINKINKIIPGDSLDLKAPSNVSIPRFVPKLSIGTDMVKEDGLAYLHAGEKVVPADVVAGGYTRENNEETNELLRTLISTIESKDYNPHISVEDIGKASSKYKANQVRVMGGSY